MIDRIASYFKRIAQDVWEEGEHHRDPNGRFTRGGGRGKVSKDDERRKGDDGDGKDVQDAGDDKSAIIREAFRRTGGGLKAVEKVHHHWEATIDVHHAGAAFSKVHALNSVLNRHGLSAKVEDPSDYNRLRIAQDGAEDPINAVCGRSAGLPMTETGDAGTSEGAKKGWQTRGGGAHAVQQQASKPGGTNSERFGLSDKDIDDVAGYMHGLGLYGYESKDHAAQHLRDVIEHGTEGRMRDSIVDNIAIKFGRKHPVMNAIARANGWGR